MWRHIQCMPTLMLMLSASRKKKRRYGKVKALSPPYRKPFIHRTPSLVPPSPTAMDPAADSAERDNPTVDQSDKRFNNAERLEIISAEID